jgi:redox-sensing transcriptional repressor
MNQQASAKSVPEPTLKRLPLYHRFLKEIQTSGKQAVSCTEIGLDLKLDPTQVRKDLEATGIVGRPRIGYILADLIEAIEQFIGWKRPNEAFLAGTGSMGEALLGYRKFEECGLKIVAAFDTNPQKIGQLIHGKYVLDISRLANLAQRMHILIGIITVPGPAAQMVAEMMVSGGIRAIWNFAPVRLRLSDDIIVHNEDLYCSLASLSQKLAKKLQAEGAAPSASAPVDQPAAPTTI